MPGEQGPAIGIDFGTTYSCVLLSLLVITPLHHITPPPSITCRRQASE